VVGKREALCEKLKQQSEAVESCEKINAVLDKKLTNDGDNFDFNKWIEGSKRFAEENSEILKAVLG